MITIWTVPGSSMHCELCDAFLDVYGYVAVRGALYRVETMAPRAARERTRWRLRAVLTVGVA